MRSLTSTLLAVAALWSSGAPGLAERLAAAPQSGTGAASPLGGRRASGGNAGLGGTLFTGLAAEVCLAVIIDTGMALTGYPTALRTAVVPVPAVPPSVNTNPVPTPA